MNLRRFAPAIVVVAALGFLAWSLPSAAIPLKSAGETEEVQSLAPVLKGVLPGVVNIAVRGTVPVKDNPLYSDPFFRRFFDLPERPPEREFQSAGSGVIVDAERGYVLTNNHVIAQADEIIVGRKDGRRPSARESPGCPPP